MVRCLVLKSSPDPSRSNETPPLAGPRNPRPKPLATAPWMPTEHPSRGVSKPKEGGRLRTDERVVLTGAPFGAPYVSKAGDVRETVRQGR